MKKLFLFLVSLTLIFSLSNFSPTGRLTRVYAAIPKLDKKAETVYICTGRYSKRYHSTSSCRGLSNCKGDIIEVDIKDAESIGRTMTTELETARTELETANQNQNTAIGDRKSKTKLRREANNAAYDAVRDLCDDGKIIYAMNFVKYQRYLIPGLEVGSVVSGTVLKNSTENIWRRSMLPTDQLKLENTGSALLKFCLAPDGATACDAVGVEVSPAGVMTITVSQLGDSANRYFNVTNKDLGNDGSYKVTVL